MNLEDLFLKLGYTKEEYQIIVSNYALIRTKDTTIYNKYLEERTKESVILSRNKH